MPNDNEFTPTMFEVREAYSSGDIHAEAEFDRMVAAVEAAVRADQAIECNNARFDLLRQLAAAQAVIAEALAEDERLYPDRRDGGTLMYRILSQSPTDALQAHDREVAAKAWDEGHKTRWRRDPDDGCTCGAWARIECGCGNYGTGKLLSLNDNPYRGAPEQERNE